MQSTAIEYIPRRPEETVLYRVVAGTSRNFSGATTRSRAPNSEIRRARIPVISRMRHSGVRFRPSPLRLVRARSRRGVFLQGTRLVSWLWRKTHGGHGCPFGGPCLPDCARPAVGAFDT